MKNQRDFKQKKIRIANNAILYTFQMYFLKIN